MGLCYQNEAGQIEPVATLVLAEVDMSHFQFQALALTRIEVIAVLEDAWEIHCRDYPDAQMDYMRRLIRDGEVNFHAITLDGVLRDGETLL